MNITIILGEDSEGIFIKDCYEDYEIAKKECENLNKKYKNTTYKVEQWVLLTNTSKEVY